MRYLLSFQRETHAVTENENRFFHVWMHTIIKRLDVWVGIYKFILQCEIEWMKNIHVSASELHGLCLCMACLVNYLWRHLCMHLVSNLNNFIALVIHYVKWARTYNRIMPPSLPPSCIICCNFLSYRHFPIRIIIYIVATYICHVALLFLTFYFLTI